MMYDVYGYCQMKKNDWLWKFWKRNDLYEKFEKGGGETKSMPQSPVQTKICITLHRTLRIEQHKSY